MSIAYSWAANHGSGQVKFHLFWAATFLFFLPAVVRLLAREASRAERLGLLVMIGLFNYLAKFLRDPSAPLFHDELIHWHQIQVMFSSGRTFVPNSIIGIIQYFPGLHLLIAELRHLTGLATFQTGSIVLALLHVVSLVGVFVIAERLFRSSWVAGLTALFYSLNPGFMFFDSQLSYESLAVVFFVWVVACAVSMQTTDRDSVEKTAWLGTGLVVAAGCIVTHHLATYILVVVLVGMACATIAKSVSGRQNPTLNGAESRRNIPTTALFAMLVLSGAMAWAFVVAAGVLGYLAPSVVGGVHQIAALMSHEQHTRQLFSKSTVPSYERIAALVTPLVLGLGALGGLRLLWRGRRQAHAATIALGLFGLLYFAAVPLMLTQSGSEGARRTWTYSYLGLGLLIVPFLAANLAKAMGRSKRALLTVVVVVVFGVILIGNVSIQVNAEYRFPGPYVYGSDTRSLSAEVLGMARWFRATQGANQKVVADRANGLALANFGDAQIAGASAGFPVWQLYFSTSLPPLSLVDDLRSSNYRYLVIDRRMSQGVPLTGVYFETGEPQSHSRLLPPPAAALSKYEFLPWAVKIYSSNNLEIYRLDFADYWARPKASPFNSGLLP